MNLTTEELNKLVDEHDLKARFFEDKINDTTTIKYRELEEYNAGNVVMLLCLIKLKQITIDEMLEGCLNQLHK